MYARCHQRKLRQMSFHCPHLPVAAIAVAAPASPIGNNFGNIKLVSWPGRIGGCLSACLPSCLQGGKTFPGGHLKEERKRRRRRIQSLLSPHSLDERASERTGTMDLRLEGECSRAEFSLVPPPPPPHLPIPIAPFECYAARHPFFPPAASCYPHGQYGIMEPIFYNGMFIRWRND